MEPVLDRDLFGTSADERSIALIREWEADAIKWYESGYHVSFSGGKDSIVTLDLVRRAVVRHRAVYAVTTIDPPELYRFIKREYPDVERRMPPLSFFQLIERKGLPTRKFRFCCSKLKETAGDDRFIVTGLRSEESPRRSGRPYVEACTSRHSMFLHPIKDWKHDEVWEYIRRRGLKYPSLYDEGFKRLGCVVCPFENNKKRSMARWPLLWEAVRRAAFRRYNNSDLLRQSHSSAQAYWDWWLAGFPARGNQDQCSLFSSGSE